MPAQSLIAPLLIAPFVLGGSEGEVARWAPAVGERIEWRWRSEGTHELEQVELVMNRGYSNESRMSFGEAQIEVRDTLELTVRDSVVERDEYDPTLLARELVRARRGTSSDWNAFGDSEEGDALETVSPLEGAQLELVWDTRAGEAVAQFAEDAERGHDQGADEELLEGLDEGLDLRGLLGARPRAPGDTWQLDEDALLRLVRPGGELALVAPEADFEGEHDTAAFGWLLGAALVAGEGHAWGRAEYQRVSWDDGRRVARVAIRATVGGSGSVREALDRLVDTLGSGQIWLDYASSIEVEHTIQLGGVLLWDLEAGRAHRLELDGRSETQLELGIEVWEVELDYIASLRGELHLTVAAVTVD